MEIIFNYIRKPSCEQESNFSQSIRLSKEAWTFYREMQKGNNSIIFGNISSKLTAISVVLLKNVSSFFILKNKG